MLSELADELLQHIEGLAPVEDRYYEVMDLDDLKAKLDTETKQVAVAISYAGTVPTRRDHGARDRASSSAMMMDTMFHILVSYWYDIEDSTDTKRLAFSLLDQIRGQVLGKHSTIVDRPWEFVEESPLNKDDKSGTIYYIQTWKVRSSQKSV